MTVKRVALLLSALIPVTGCATGTWQNLPPAREHVLAYHDPADPNANRAIIIARRLTAARPLPVEKVYVLSSGFLNRSLGPGRFPDDNAGAGRCSMGDPPPDGCIYIGDLLLERLSDEALAGVLAHELGHLERGHRSISPAAKELGVALGGLTYAALVARREREDERETDQAALARLTAAGYCAGPVMQRTFDELAELTLWGRGGGGVLSSHPGYGERVARAGTACGPLRAGWRVIAVEAAGLERLAGGPYEDEATCRAAQALLGLVAPGGRALCVPGHLQKWQLVLVRPPAGFKSAHWQFTSEEHCGSAARISFPSHRFRCERLE